MSQGHSDAIRRIDGVQGAKQYTIPKEEALVAVRAGENPELATRDKHIRVCYVVAKEGADKAKIEREIVTMPNYFADYDTTVHFISQEELDKNLGESERIQCFSVPWLKKYNKEWIEKIAECYKNVIENHEALLSPEKDGVNQGGRWHGFTNMD